VRGRFNPCCPLYAADASDSDDYIGGDSVEGKDTNKLLEGDAVNGIATKTPVPAPEPTQEDLIQPDVIPTKEPVAKPAPTEIPTPKPKPTAKPAPRPTPKKPRRGPLLCQHPCLRMRLPVPGLEVSKAAIAEIVMKRTAENFFGLLTTERKFTLSLVLENKGAATSYYTVVTLKSGDTSILTSDPEKEPGHVMPGSRLDVVYSLIVLGSYSGDLKLPAFCKSYS